MEQPQEIEDEDYERTWDRVAAVDIAKATGVACTRVPDEDRPGRRLTRIWTVQATAAGVTELGDHLRCQGTEVVTSRALRATGGSGTPSWRPRA
jgi:transposase